MGALIVFAVAFGTYALTASPTAGWLDSAEFVAASASLGVPHSPGHPLPVLLGKAAMLIPLGDLPFRINLASAAAVALAAAALYQACMLLTRLAAPSLTARTHGLLATGTALGFAWSWAAWYQAVRAEVYGLLALLLLAALVQVLRYTAAQSTRRLVAAGLLCGLALANHHFVALLFLIPTSIFVLASRPGVKACGTVALAGVLGLAAFLYVPVRAARDPQVNWGDPDTAERFGWTVTAKAFQKSITAVHDTSSDALQVAGALTEQASAPAMISALLGAYLLLRQRATRGSGLLLCGILVAVAAGPALVGFDPDNPDAYGYLLPALACLILLAASGLATLVHALGIPRLGTAVGLLAVAFSVTQAATHARASSLRNAHGADHFAQAALDVPPRAILVTSYFETMFQLWALRAVEAARPDVTILDQSMHTHPGGEAQARRRHPDLARLIDAPLRTGAPIPVAALAATERAIAYEPHFELAGRLDADALAHLVPDGISARFFAQPPDDDTRARYETRELERSTRLQERLAGSPAERDEKDGRRMLLWSAFLRARLYCTLGRTEAFLATLGRARLLGPDDPALAELELSCAPRR